MNVTYDGRAELAWRISSRCESGGCVEVAPTDDGVAVRHSAQPEGPILHYSAAEWRAFLAGVQNEEFTFNR